MNNPKPCVLIVENTETDDTRVFVFDDHIQAADTASHFSKAGYGWAMYPFEHIAAGRKPANMPIIQMDLFGKESSS